MARDKCTRDPADIAIMFPPAPALTYSVGADEFTMGTFADG